MKKTFLLLFLTAFFFGCNAEDSTSNTSATAADSEEMASVAGTWRAVLQSPGGELPFTLVIADDLSAEILNGHESTPLSGVRQEGRSVVLSFEWYDSEITAQLESDDRMSGMWRKTVPEGDSKLPFVATRGEAPRFLPLQDAQIEPSPAELEIGGSWSAIFTDEDGTEMARGEFLPEEGSLTGTFLTPTGDYRFLAGSYEGGILRLSTFDGAHAFLFQAKAEEDGSLAGDFWSRDTYHATWTAQPLTGDETILPDAWEQVGLTNDDGSFSFTFPDLDGNSVSLSDERFAGKAVIVNIFGSWCPNCNDEAPFLAKWHEQYKDQGLEVIGLAYEFTGDPERDRRVVRAFAERYGIEYPILLAGTSDKADAAATLPDLTAVLAYPMSIFIGRDGKVRKIHSGFAGPGTGVHHERLITKLETTIATLLAEAPPATEG